MKMLKPSPTLGRNDFDLSHRTVHTANFGELIPSMCVETVPGDKIKVRISDLVRAEPMVTSPFLRAKQHVDVWFVPYNLMWSRFNEFIADKDEPASSALHDRLFVPQCTIADLVSAYNQYTNNLTPHLLDVHYQNCARRVARNLDLLGLPGTWIRQANADAYAWTGNSHSYNVVNLWRLAAYNLIWYREYRQQYYDTGAYNLPSAIASSAIGPSYLFNFDWLQCDTAANANIETNMIGLLAAMIQPRFRCWKKDLFTGLMPSTQFGNVSVVESPVLPENVATNNRAVTVNSGDFRYSTSVSANTAPSDWNIGTLAVKSKTDILALRKSEAIQRWRENSLRAGNQIEDNFEAHYGVKPKSHLNVHPQFVASFDAPLNIGDINSQAQTGTGANQYLGDVAGKGIMSFDGSSEFTFETNDFGVLMGIYSILPEAEYNANGIDRLNCLLERQDYFYPEYENLGLEAVAKNDFTINYSTDNVIGYAPRYYAYKQKIDRCCGEMMRYTPFYPSAPDFNGQFRQWCSPKYDVDDVAGSTLPLSVLYVNPFVYDVNFVNSVALNDQFIVDFFADVQAIRHMTVSGMPSY